MFRNDKQQSCHATVATLAIIENRVKTLEERCSSVFADIDEHKNSKNDIEKTIQKLSMQLDTFIEEFKKHDIKEMAKYDSIKKELYFFRRIVWIAIGAGVAANAIYFALDLFDKAQSVGG